MTLGDKFRNWDWSDTVGSVLLSGVISLLIFAFTAAWHRHDVSYYYVTTEGVDNTTCVYAYREWTSNDKAYCSDDIQKVLYTVEKLNQTLPKR